jgi:regulator of sigma E protease
MGIVMFLIVLSVLVFVHELGHFLVARYYGVTVKHFSIGFGPRLVTKYWKGTNWSISLIPLGGYVQMKGQEDLNPAKTSQDPDSYSVLTPFQRIMILLAGPGANFLLAFVLYFAVGLMEHKELSNVVGSVKKDMPAYNAGIQPKDKIVKINDTMITKWDDLKEVISTSQGPIKVYVERNGRIRGLVVNPEITDTKNMFKESIQRRMIGIAPGGFIDVSYNPIDSFIYAWDKTVQASTLIFQSVQKLIQGIVPTSEVGGVISIGKVISDASDTGIVALFVIAALISVNLGVLNLLPIPALDGGHIMFNLYEMITKRAPSEKVLIQLTIGGWVILFGLMGLGLYNDINRFF